MFIVLISITLIITNILLVTGIIILKPKKGVVIGGTDRYCGDEDSSYEEDKLLYKGYKKTAEVFIVIHILILLLLVYSNTIGVQKEVIEVDTKTKILKEHTDGSNYKIINGDYIFKVVEPKEETIKVIRVPEDEIEIIETNKKETKLELVYTEDITYVENPIIRFFQTDFLMTTRHETYRLSQRKK